MKVLVLILVAAVIQPVASAPDEAGFPPPVSGVAAFAWLGSWSELRSPSVAAPATDGTSSGDLGGVFDVRWERRGTTLTATIERLTDEWCGRLAVRFDLSPQTQLLTCAVNDLPVPVPLDEVGPGRVVSTWAVGAPRWMTCTSPNAEMGVQFASVNHHGFFLYRNEDGGFSAHVGLDCASVGDSVQMQFELMPGANADAAHNAASARFGYRTAPPPDAEAAQTLRATGFVRADAAGVGFVTGDGVPWFAVGNNQAHLPTLTPSEQEEVLERLQAAGMDVVRLLLADWYYRPLPGAWNQEALERLRETIDRCAAHGLRVILCLEYGSHGSQYNCAIHLSSTPGDLYIMPEPLEWYAEMVRLVVEPLRDDTAIAAWDVSNEPSITPDPNSPIQRNAFQEWLKSRYGEVQALRDAWQQPDLPGFDGAGVPADEPWKAQSTAQARDFFDFAGDAVSEAMIARCRLVKQADPNHMVTISHGSPRQLRGHEGAELFDFWAPHTYDLWINGPAVDHHVLYLVAGLRDALPDRRRPVVIEEFGINPGPRFPDEVCADHISQFLAAGEKWGAGGIMHWWEMSPEMYARYAAAQPYLAEDHPTKGLLAVYLPPAQEWQDMFYHRYMSRRAWAKAMASAAEESWDLRVVTELDRAAGAQALLVLADAVLPDELACLKAMKCPVFVQPGAEDLAALIDGAGALPDDWDAQIEVWRGLHGTTGA